MHVGAETLNKLCRIPIDLLPVSCSSSTSVGFDTVTPIPIVNTTVIFEHTITTFNGPSNRQPILYSENLIPFQKVCTSYRSGMGNTSARDLAINELGAINSDYLKRVKIAWNLCQGLPRQLSSIRNYS